MAAGFETGTGNWTIEENQDFVDEDQPFDPLIARAVCISVVMVLALAGNTIIIAVIVRTEALRNITGLFLVNLAIADLSVILFTMPFIIDVAIWGRWRFSESWCTVSGFLEELFTAASIATLAVISYDRYVAIVKPLHYQQLITPLRAGLILIYLWCHSTALASLPFFHFAEYSYVRDVGACTVNWKDATLSFTIAINLFCYFIPLVVILICYSKIFVVARKVKRQVKPSNQARHPSVAERSVVEMDNFSVPANFGIHHETRPKTIMFRGNLQIAESIHQIKSTSTGHVSGDKSIRGEIIEEKDENHFNASNVKTIHNYCEIEGEIKLKERPILDIRRSKQESNIIIHEGSEASRQMARRGSRHLSIEETLNNNQNLPGTCLDIETESKPLRRTTTELQRLHENQTIQHLPGRNESMRASFLSSIRRRSMRRTLRMQRLRDTKAATTLLILVGAFIVCWTPYVVVCFLVQSGKSISSTLYGRVFVTALCNSANNVFVYGIFNTKIRKGFKHLFQSCWLFMLGDEEDERPFPNNISHSIKVPNIEVTGQFLPLARQRSL